MRQALKSARLYFSPIIVLNTVAMTLTLGQDVWHSIYFGIVIASLASFGFILNDLWDRDVDLVNKPGHFEFAHRPVIRIATAMSAVYLLIGLGLASRLGHTDLGVASFLAVGLSAYTVFLRRLLVLPTVLASILSTSPTWSPLILYPTKGQSAYFLVILALAVIIAGRETMMDVRDRRGDALGGRRTLPVVYGAHAATKWGAGLCIVGVCILFTSVYNILPPLPGTRQVLIMAIMFGILLSVGYTALRLLRSPGECVSIQRFVLASRISMALFPFTLLLSHI